MRIAGLLSASLLTVVLASCATPGGIYRGYEGPERDAKEIAILDWSGWRDVEITHIDHKPVDRPSRSFDGMITTIAHLLPGSYMIRVKNNWERLGDQIILMNIEVQSGHSYEIKEDQCHSCEPFEIRLWLADAETGEAVEDSGRKVFGPTGYAKEQELSKCLDKCPNWFLDEKIEECERSCKRTWADRSDFFWPWWPE